MKRTFYLLFVCVSVFLLSIYTFSNKPVNAGNTLSTELLSDHSLTTADTSFNNYGYGLEISGNIAHVYWQESGNNTEGIDLFYRQLPTGDTIRLSDPALSEGDVSTVWFDTAVGLDGTFHMIWLEDTNSPEAGDLFYWSANTGTLLLSDHSQTEGYVQPAFQTLFIKLDQTGNPHVIWHEETGTAEGEDLFYWSPSIGTVLLTDRSQTQGNDVNLGPNSLMLGDNGTAHITWAEYGNDGTTPTYFYWNPSLLSPVNLPNIRSSIVTGNVAHIIGWANNEGPISYWNSSTQSTQTIPSSSDPGGIIFVGRMVADSTNAAHVLWVEGNSNVCLSHWDSINQTTEDLILGDACRPLFNVYVDNSDNLHTVVVDQPMGNFRFRYWNSSLLNAVPVVVGDSISNGKSTGITDSGLVHITWTDSSSADDNYYHWDNSNQTASNLSQIAGADTHISSAGRQIEQSSNGELYMLWSEEISGTGTFQNLYWNSATGITQNLFTELGINSIDTDLNMTMDFLESGAPYMIWHGIPISGPEGLYLWDSTQDEVPLLGESLPCSEVSKSFSSDSDQMGNIYLTWQDDTTYINYFWSKASGQVDLSLTPAPEAFCDPPLVAVGDNGNVFIMWIEESDVAGEGLDVYGGWLASPGGNIFLPMINK